MSAILAKRSPKLPMLTASTGSPGERKLTTAASRPPVPDEVRMSTSFAVPNQGRMPALARTEELLELRAAVVDHLPRARLADGVGQGRRAGDAQVLGRHGVSSRDAAGVGSQGVSRPR